MIALAIGCVVATYSVVDSFAVKVVPPLFFVAVINLVPGALAAPVLLTRYRGDVVTILGKHRREAFLVAAGGSIAYFLVLTAFQKSNAAYVVAVREFSVVIATVLGIIFLKESLYRRKIIAIALIVAGMVIIKAT